MTATDPIRERIEAFASQLAEELGQVDDSNAASWIDAVENRVIEISDAVVTALMEKTRERSPVEDESTQAHKNNKGQAAPDLTNDDNTLAMPRMQRVSHLADRRNMGIVSLASILHFRRSGRERDYGFQESSEFGFV